MMDDYRNWCFEKEQYEAVLAMTDVGEESFIGQWSKKVAAQFNLKEEDVANAYKDPMDQYSDNQFARRMWKATVARGVNSTPSVFVNGVLLEKPPTTTDNWMKLLNDTYNKQWHRLDEEEEPTLFFN